MNRRTVAPVNAKTHNLVLPPVIRMWLQRRGSDRPTLESQARDMLALTSGSPQAPVLIVRCLAADLLLARVSAESLKRGAGAKERAEYERIAKMHAAEWAAFEQECERARGLADELLGFDVGGPGTHGFRSVGPIRASGDPNAGELEK